MVRRNVILLTFDIEGLYGNADKEIRTILEELRTHHAYGTFFFTASYAQQSTEIVEAILDGGHEIGCHGLDHYTHTFLQQGEVRKRLKKALLILERHRRTSALGFRAPNFAVNSTIIRVVEKLGFRYDSSVLPSIPIPLWYGFAKAPIYPYHPNLKYLERKDGSGEFWEIPLAVFPHLRLPCFGGWWLRNLGETWFRMGLDLLLHHGPATVCFHDWEFLQPRDIKIPVQFKSEHSMPPLTFRNTGAYVLKAFQHLLKNYRSRVLSISMAIEKDMLSKK